MRRSSLALGLALAFAGTAHAQPPSYLNFEAGPVRPLAISPDGARLFAVNTPDDRLEIFDLDTDVPTLVASVPVGLAPVAVAAESDSRVWVVNHLSDSISIVDVDSDPPRVVRTLLVGDEPNDIVFAGSDFRRAFVTCAHRGQNHPVPRGDFATEGIGRADVWVFDADALGAPLGGTAIEILQLFGDRPRALAVSPDGARVFAAVFLSGNGTTAITEGLVCDGGPTAPPCGSGPGGLPAPVENHEGVFAPESGLIVRFDRGSGAWLDELERDWSGAVRFSLPDEDVFEIDADANPPVQTRSFATVGTVLYAMATHPTSGELFVSNTEAFNHVRFEGRGTYVREQGLRGDGPYSVRGHLHEARITVIDGATVSPRAINSHIDYGAEIIAPETRNATLATPLGMAIASDGTLYVAAYGSSAIGVFDAEALAAGEIDTSVERAIRLDVDSGPVGPTGLAIDEDRARLYVATRFDNSLVTLDLSTRAIVSTARMHTPEPESAIVGRPMLYDARFTSTNGEASCGSCHVFGDLDGLAWDLGDPDGDVSTSPNPRGLIGGGQSFHPLKGPMTTQSLRGMADHGPLHWRGDRTGGNRVPRADPLDEHAGFDTFNVAFEGLLGREEGPLRDEEMQRFTNFALGILYPPNPIRQLDNSLRADEARGRDIYFEREGIDAISTCNGCHVVDRTQGFFGSDGRTTFENEPQEFKVAHLRNAYQKVGMFGMPEAPFFNPGHNGPMGPQIRGFGYLHDGSTDTLFRFMHASVFGFGSDVERRDVEAFVMAFDTNLAPIVGQQVTLDAASDAAVEDRIDLLEARALTPSSWLEAPIFECDLVARGVVEGEARSYFFDGGLYRSDREDEPAMTSDDLRVLGRAGAMTYTCAPPGSGERMGFDRDEDGARDRDELDDGEDPAARPFIAIPDPMIPGELPSDRDAGMVMPGEDAGSERMDGGAASIDGGPMEEPGGCGCRAARREPAPAIWLILGAALLLRRRR